MKIYIFLFNFLLFSSASFAQIGYKNYHLTESLDSIEVKLKNAGIKYEKNDSCKYGRIQLSNGKFVPAKDEFKSIFGDNKDKAFIAQITCTQINYEADKEINVTLSFDYNNELMEIVVGGIEIEFDVLKQAMTKKYGESINRGYNKTEFNVPKFDAIIELSNYTTRYVTYKNNILINSHYKKQYKDQKIAADKELKTKTNSVKDF